MNENANGSQLPEPEHVKPAISSVREEEKDAPPVVSSDALLRGGRELVIRHGSERYRLLLTKSNKLILTK
jgi:hemin uptake protein HemP